MNEISKCHLKLLGAFICLFIPVVGNAQQEIPGNSVDWTMINTITGQYTLSPQAAAIEKFGAYPVNKATGIPEISIPIYTIKSGSVEYPITLSYHMGGIRVDEIPSWVGLGWSLSGNGVINRTIQGIPDERTDKPGWLTHGKWPYHKDDFWENVNKENAENLISILYNLIDNWSDTGSDIYRYSVNGLSGGFVYDFDRQLVQTPRTDNKIERDERNNFTITDAKGVQYKFFATDVEESWNRDAYGTRMSPVTWQVSQIISADRADTLKFAYAQAERYEESRRSFSLTRGRPYQAFPSVDDPIHCVPMSRDVVSLNPNFTTTENTEKLLSSIKFPGGEIVFNKQARTDKGRKCISEITVYNTTRAVVKRVQFEYDYFYSGNSSNYTKNERRLKLTKIKVSGSDRSDVREYRFSYNEYLKLPTYDETKSNGVGNDYCGQDYWGFYNGITTNKSLLLTEHANSFQANREPREDAMKAGILTRIDYPTGGFTLFETEANRARKDGREQIVGGLRIARITSYTGEGDPNPHVTQYTYEDGTLVYFPEPAQYEMEGAFSFATAPGGNSSSGDVFDHYTGQPDAPAITYMEHPRSPTGSYQGSPVIYLKVTETAGYYRNIGMSDQIVTEGKTVYMYEYPKVFRGSLDTYEPSDLAVTSASPLDWMNGHLKKMEIYKKAGQGWELLKEVENEYRESLETVWFGTSISSRVIFQGFSNMQTGGVSTVKIALCYFNHLWTRMGAGWHHLVKTTEREFSEPETRIITTVYEYDNMDAPQSRRNMLVSGIRQFVEDTPLGRKEYTYAHQADPVAANSMNYYNMLAYPYEERVYDQRDELVTKNRLNYVRINAGAADEMIKPAKVWRTYSASGPDVLEMEYLRYDKRGNPVEVRDKAGMSTVYLWAYCGQYPLAEIRNASYSQVADILGEALIELNMLRSSPSSDYLTRVNALRTNPTIQDAHITTYEFDSPHGITKSTDPSGRSTYYEYNSFGSLFRIKDDGQSPVQEFQYKYVN